MTSHLGLRSIGVVIVCGLIAGTVACSTVSPQGQRGPEPTLGPVPAVDRPALVSRPIDAYLASAEQVTALAQVSLAAMNNCLKQQSVEGSFSVAGQGGLDGFVKVLVDDRVLRGDLWGFFGVDTASTYGYGHPGSTGEGLQMVPPPGVHAENSCGIAGQDALGGRSWLDLSLPISLPDGGPPVPSWDSRWVAAVAEWRACMQKKGFSYDTPLAAIGDKAWRGVAVSATQIATASADVACKISTNLIGIGVAVQAAYDQQYIDTHRTKLDAAVTQRDAYVKGEKQSR